MAQMTNYTENALADFFFRDAGFSKPTQLYVGLFTSAPSDAGGGTEVSTIGTGYARQQLNPSNANWEGTHGSNTGNSSGTNGQVRNSVALVFPDPLVDWGTVTHFAIFDQAGNMLFYGQFNVAKVVQAGDQGPVIAINAMTITFM
jgi:hypothetical protein